MRGEDKARLDTEEAEAVTRLLCCVCQDQNTTFRYEVVYKQADRSITILDLTPANREELRGLTHDLSDEVRPEDSLEDSSETAEYYNFPPKHPRHGHLKWPVWRPSVVTEVSPVTASSSLVSSGSYPDHPIHIPTFTLQRINNLLSSKTRRGNTAP